jgi:hypothetical protein
MADQEANVDNITRITVVDHRAGAQPFGRVFEAWNINLDISIQDGGRTLKLFVTERV